MTLIGEHQSAVIQNLLDEVAELRERVEFLEAQFARIPENILYEVIEIREVGKEEAKAEIMALFDASRARCTTRKSWSSSVLNWNWWWKFVRN